MPIVSEIFSDRLNIFLHSYGGPCPATVIHDFNSICLLLVFNIPRMFLIYIVEVLEILLFRIAGISVFDNKINIVQAIQIIFL